MTYQPMTIQQVRESYQVRSDRPNRGYHFALVKTIACATPYVHSWHRTEGGAENQLRRNFRHGGGNLHIQPIMD